MAFYDDDGIDYGVTCGNCGQTRGVHYTDSVKRLTYCLPPRDRERTGNYSAFRRGVVASPKPVSSKRIIAVTAPDGETFDICRLTMNEIAKAACGTTLHDIRGKAWTGDIVYDRLKETPIGTVRDLLTDYGFRTDNRNYMDYSNNYHLQDILDNEMKPIASPYHRMGCGCAYDESTGIQIQQCENESHRQGKVIIQEGWQWIPMEMATPDGTPGHYICIDKMIKEAPQYYWWDGNQFPFVNDRITHWLVIMPMPTEEAK